MVCLGGFTDGFMDDNDSKKRIPTASIPRYLFRFGNRQNFLKILSLIFSVGLFLCFIMGDLWFIALVLSICSGGAAMTLYLGAWILSRDDGSAAMRKVSDPIREGAEGFLSIQYSAIRKIAVGLAGMIMIGYLFRERNLEAKSGLDTISNLTLGSLTAVTFLFGAFCSAVAGYLSMWVSSQTNIRVAAAASRSYSLAFYVCFRGGAFSAILSLTLCVTGVTLVYLFLYVFFYLPGTISQQEIPLLMTGFGFGASFVALFMQLGGGIYTKAADVGADLVGKIEIGIPEDDPRNPAVIADLVGDMVGDCVGSSADVFESISAEIIGAMILAAALANEAKVPSPTSFAFFPLMIHAFDIIVSSIGILSVKISKKDDENCLKEGKLGESVNPMTPIKNGYIVALVLAAIAFVFSTWSMLYVEAAPSKSTLLSLSLSILIHSTKIVCLLS